MPTSAKSVPPLVPTRSPPPSVEKFDPQPESTLLSLPFYIRYLILEELVRTAPPLSLLIPQHRAPHLISGTLAGGMSTCKQLHSELKVHLRALPQDMTISLRQPSPTVFSTAVPISLPQRMDTVKLASDVVSAIHWMSNPSLAAEFLNPTWIDKVWIPDAAQSKLLQARLSGLALASTVQTVEFSIPEVKSLEDLRALANKLRLIHQIFPAVNTTHVRIHHSSRACHAHACRRDRHGAHHFFNSAHWWCEVSHGALVYECKFYGLKEGAKFENDVPPFSMGETMMKRGGNVADVSNVCCWSFYWDL